MHWARARPGETHTVDDPEAKLSGFANPKMGEWIDGAIDADLEEAGCEEMTAKYREGDRSVTDGGTYLRPTIVYCESFEHPLSNREFLCPYASVWKCRRRMLNQMGESWSSPPSPRTKHFKRTCSPPR